MFADDTLLITRHARAMNILIKEIEIESAKYNMSLNKNKCELIASNPYTPNVHFMDGQKLKQVTDADKGSAVRSIMVMSNASFDSGGFLVFTAGT